MEAPSVRVWVLFATASVILGVPYVLIKVGVEHGMPPFLLAWSRVAVAAVVLLAWSLPGGRVGSSLRRWRALLLFAVIEIAIPFPMLALGETRVTSSTAAILIASVPLLVAAIGLKFEPAERIDRRRLLGLLVGLSGVVAMVGVDVGTSPAKLVGIGAVAVAACGFAAGAVFLRRHLGEIDVVTLMAIAMTVGALVLAAPAAASLPSADPDLAGISAAVALGVVSTALAFVLLAVLVRAIGAGRALLVTYINPVVAVLLGVAFLGEKPGPGALGGLVLILTGSWVAASGRLPLLRPRLDGAA